MSVLCVMKMYVSEWEVEIQIIDVRIQGFAAVDGVSGAKFFAENLRFKQRERERRGGLRTYKTI